MARRDEERCLRRRVVAAVHMLHDDGSPTYLSEPLSPRNFTIACPASIAMGGSVTGGDVPTRCQLDGTWAQRQQASKRSSAPRLMKGQVMRRTLVSRLPGIGLQRLGPFGAPVGV